MCNLKGAFPPVGLLSYLNRNLLTLILQLNSIALLSQTAPNLLSMPRSKKASWKQTNTATTHPYPPPVNNTDVITSSIINIPYANRGEWSAPRTTNGFFHSY